jgi:16S rRNA (guanine966-N2)-methyltransferase
MGLRIISGQWRGRILATPKGDVTRPTADRTREALFSMLVSRMGSLTDLRVADLFSGSGALGLEALSRGAASCIFVEQDRAALDSLRSNVALLDAGRMADIRAISVLSMGVAPTAPLDLIMMDPPYGSGAGAVALEKLARLGWIGPATIISIESAKKEAIEAKQFEVVADRVHGKARITLLRLATATDVP